MILVLYTYFLTTLFFTTSLSLFKSKGTGTNLLTSSLSDLLFKLFKPYGTIFVLSISNLSTSDFKLAESTFLAKEDSSTPVAFFNSVFVAYLDKSYSTFILSAKDFGSGKYSLIYTMPFLSIQLLNELLHSFNLTYSLSTS